MGYFRTGATSGTLKAPGPTIVVDPGPRRTPRRGILTYNTKRPFGDEDDATQAAMLQQVQQAIQAGNQQASAIDEVSQIVNTVTGLFNGGAPSSDAGLVFNTTKYPGICKAGDRNTLNAVIAFQKQLNRVAQAKGLPKIANDGDLGPSTMSLYAAVNNAAGGSIATGFGIANCTDITADIVGITGRVKAFADSLGASSSVSSPPAVRTPSFVDPTTQKEVNAPGAGTSLPDMFGAMNTPMKVAFVGLVAGAGYFMFFKKKAASPRRRTTRR